MSALIPLRRHAEPLDLRTLVTGVAAWIVGASISFRDFLLSSFDLIYSNLGDGRLNIYLHEHLFNALQGRAKFFSPAMFYPQQHVLGFTDAFLLDVAPYAALRWLKFDPFLSFQILVIMLSLCCFIASLIISTRYLRLRPTIAICAAALITFPNNLLQGAADGHTQLFALYYVPGIVLLALLGIEDFPCITRWSIVRTAFVGALFGLLFATGYYVAWMFAITAIIALCVTGIVFRRDLIAVARDYFKPGGALIGTAILGFGIGIVPLAFIYFPILPTISGRTFPDFVSFSPFPKDAINVGEWNLVWGSLVERLLGNSGSERILAVSPGMTTIFLILAYRRYKDLKDPNNRCWQPVFIFVCAAVWVLSLLLITRIGTFSLFWLPAHILPGANAIRAGGRIQLLANLWVVLGCAVSMQYWIDTGPVARQPYRKPLVAGMLIFCLVEQINVYPAGLSRSQQFAWLLTVPMPPVECHAFLVNVRNRPTSYPHEEDAMFISLKTGLPTLNGSSGWFPPGWLFEDPNIDYFDAARQWINQNELKQEICVYDITGRYWSRFY